ncbi:unnamed protein product [Rangifer tarandus platyrhynchus]|uniref:Uncharacterized protein n=1 Tax=Rangifer tarandus platyrhynchus TaxID=3082113 RepID=A0ABN8XIX4_RANTA|nr:unnamed protein product [Rangifer tarandus platyrhynchus]
MADAVLASCTGASRSTWQSSPARDCIISTPNAHVVFRGMLHDGRRCPSKLHWCFKINVAEFACPYCIIRHLRRRAVSPQADEATTKFLARARVQTAEVNQQSRCNNAANYGAHICACSAIVCDNTQSEKERRISQRICYGNASKHPVLRQRGAYKSKFAATLSEKRPNWRREMHASARFLWCCLDVPSTCLLRHQPPSSGRMRRHTVVYLIWRIRPRV